MINRRSIKLGMLALFLLLSGVKTFIKPALAFSGTLTATATTAAPGEPTCATSGCHTGVVNAGSGVFYISIAPPDAGSDEYTVTVRSSAEDNTRKKWGFQLTALTAANTPAGEFIDQSPSRDEEQFKIEVTTRLGPNADRNYVSHTRRSSFTDSPAAIWQFKWRANGNEFPVKFYAAGVQADGNGSSVEDETYTDEITLYPDGDANKPKILDAQVEGKALIIIGENFSPKAKIRVDGVTVKTANDADNPTTRLIAKKAGKSIKGRTVTLLVRNNTGAQSNEYERQATR